MFAILLVRNLHPISRALSFTCALICFAVVCSCIFCLGRQLRVNIYFVVSVDGEMEDGEISSNESENEEQSCEAVPEPVTASPAVIAASAAVESETANDESLTSNDVVVSNKYQDIFGDENEADGTSNQVETEPNRTAPSTLPDAEEVVSTLYENVPSPGKFLDEPQVNVVSQSMNEAPVHDTGSHTKDNTKMTDAESSDSDDGRVLMAADPSVTSSDSQFKVSTVNWLADLDMNIDELQDELVASEKECAEPSASSANSVNVDLSGEILADRVPTPEITAQRYRSQDFGLRFGCIDKTKDAPKTAEKKTKSKVHSSASTVGGDKSISSSKSDKEGKAKKMKKSRSVDKPSDSSTSRSKDKKSSKRRSPYHSNKTSKSTSSSHDSKTSPDQAKIGSTEVTCEKPNKTSLSKSPQRTSKISRNEPQKHDRANVEKPVYSKKASKSKATAIDNREHSRSRSNSSHDRRGGPRQSSDGLKGNRRSSTKTQTSIFKRLSERPREPPSLSERFDSIESHGRRRSPSPRHSTGHTCRSPGWYQHGRHRSSSPLPYRHNAGQYHRDYAYSGRRDTGRQSKNNYFDDRTRSSYNISRNELDPGYVSPKRYRAEWEPVSKVITLEHKQSVVKTYDVLRADMKKGRKGRADTADNDRDKSPVRFPSPDIKVVAAPKGGKGRPMIVVISDSD